MYAKVKPVGITCSVGKLCCQPYPGHKRGCPKFHVNCFPGRNLFQDIINVRKTCYVIWSEFNIAAHMKKLKKLYPHWTERQLRCVLYWQPKARKAFQVELKKFQEDHPGMTYVYEGNGVEIAETMKQLGMDIWADWKKGKVTRIAVIAGTRK